MSKSYRPLILGLVIVIHEKQLQWKASKWRWDREGHAPKDCHSSQSFHFDLTPAKEIVTFSKR